jgi:hypothetical protein
MAKLHSDLTIGDRVYRRGEAVPWKFIYPFFLVHMLVFGASGFFMAYKGSPASVGFLYMHGGIAIFVYMTFYFVIFGREEVRWMLINAALGVWGISAEMDWLLSFFGKTLSSYPLYVHVIPFLYYVLYTFLLRQAVLQWTGAREDEARARVVNRGYVAVSLIVYTGFHLL